VLNSGPLLITAAHSSARGRHDPLFSSLDAAAFDQCLQSGRQRAEVVNIDVDEGRRLEVTGTPNFFINGRRLPGAEPLATCERMVDSELTRKAGP
jgi:protein-disulfide isomerase